MKRSILLFTAAAGIAFLTLSSYKDGPAFNFQGDLTGSPTSTGSCAGNGCHSTPSSATVVTITIFDKTTNTAVTDNKYIPNHLYEVSLDGAVTNSAGLPKFGFQATIVNTSHNMVGSYSLTNLQHRQVTVGTKQIVEHNSPLSASGSVYNTKFDWTAPGTGAGAVSIYSVFNAVNFDDHPTGDQPSLPASLTLAENTTSISGLSGNMNIQTYPNPVSAFFTLKFENAEAGIYSISVYDITGKKVYDRSLSIQTKVAEAELSSASWIKGLYFVRIMKDGAQRIIPISKQ